MTDPDDSSSPFRERAPLSIEDGLALVETAELELLGRMPWSSNATFLCDLQVGTEIPAQAIYKPAEGERPLRDFPSGLHRREVASFRLSQQLGWDLVPPTVERDDQFGPGSVQLYIPADYDEHYFTMLETGEHNEQFKLLCAFDVVANSTDRKGGHCLLGVIPFGDDDELNASAGGERQDAHDALAVGTCAAAFEPNLGAESARDLNQCAGGAQMNAKIVGDANFP